MHYVLFFEYSLNFVITVFERKYQEIKGKQYNDLTQKAKILIPISPSEIKSMTIQKEAKMWYLN